MPYVPFIRFRKCVWAEVFSVLVIVTVPVGAAYPANDTTRWTTTGNAPASFTGLAQSPEANLFVGASTTAVPFELPSGRRMTPTLGLKYSSGGSFSPYGFGWDMPVPKVQRSVKFGAPRCDHAPNDPIGAREFVVALQDATVECTLDSQSLCVPIVEESFLRIRYQGNNTWKVNDKSGTAYYFGETPQARTGTDTAQIYSGTAGPGGCGYTYSWALTRIEDTNGNRVDYDYLGQADPATGSNQMSYLSRVQYGANLSPGSVVTDHPFEVSFNWSPLASGPVSTTGGFEAEIKKALTSVEVLRGTPGARSLVRRYEMEYAATPPNRYLSRVHLVGSDGSTLKNLLGQSAGPTFEYSDPFPSESPAPTDGFDPNYQTIPRPDGLRGVRRTVSSADLTYPGWWNNIWTYRQILDMNGDGFADMVDSAESGCGYDVYLGGPAGFDDVATHWAVEEIPLEPYPECPTETGAIRLTKNHIDGIAAVDEYSDTTQDIFDISGDSIPDLVVTYHYWTSAAHPDPARTWAVLLGNHGPTGWRFGPEIQYWRVPAPIPGHRIPIRLTKFRQTFAGWTVTANDNKPSSMDVMDVIDLNGDGLPDLVDARGPGYASGWTVWWNTGSGFDVDHPFNYPAPYRVLRFSEPGSSGQDRQVAGLVDMNGDGYLDQVVSWDRDLNSNYPGYWRVHLGYGRGMSATPRTWLHQGGTHTSNHRWISINQNQSDLIDMNGDGLPDWVYADGSADWSWKVWLNTGTEFQSWPTVWGAPSGRFRGNTDNSVLNFDTVDIDGDGRPEVVETQSTSIRIHRQRRSAWCTSTNGVDCAATTGSTVAPNPDAERSHFLGAMRSGIGGTTVLDYRPSTQWNNWIPGDPAQVPTMPFVMWTLTGITHSDGLCPPGTSWCGYDGEHTVSSQIRYEFGRYDPVQRESRGFGTVEVTDAAGNVTVTNFLQDRARKGKPYLTNRYAADVNRYSKPLIRRASFFECASQADDTYVECDEELLAPVWVLASAEIDITYSNYQLSAYKQRSRTNVAFARCGGKQYGNASDVRVVPGGDSQVVRTTTDYACHTASDSYIVNKPTHVATYQAYSTLLEEKWFFYDTEDLGVLTKGNLTRTESYVDSYHPNLEPSGCTEDSGKRCIATEAEYDQIYGNVTASIDGEGNRTEVEFEPMKIYPAITKQKLSATSDQRVSTSYSLACGKLESETIRYWNTAPVPAERTQTRYDAFCRPVAAALPGQSLDTNPQRTLVYRLGTEGHPSLVTAFERHLAADYTPYGAPGSSTCPAGAACAPSRDYLPSWTLTDGLGRPIQTQRLQVVGSAATPSLIANTISYDSAGRRVRSYVPHAAATAGTYASPGASAFTSLEYDPLGLVKKAINPDQSWSETDNISVAWQTTVSDECHTSACNGGAVLGGQMIERRDGEGRVVERTAMDGGVIGSRTLVTYDAMGRVIESIQWHNGAWDPRTRITTTYDTVGRKLTVTDPDTGTTTPGVWRYGYDNAGNLRYVDDPKPGQYVRICYDKLNRVTRRDVYAGTGTSLSCPSSSETRYAYDNPNSTFGVGRVHSVTEEPDADFNLGDDVSETFYVYDARGQVRLTSRYIEHLGRGEWANVGYAYDDSGTLVSTEYPDSEIVYNRYNLAGQFVGLDSSLPMSYVSAVQYDAFGRPVLMQRGNTTRDIRTYSPNASEAFRLASASTVRTANGTASSASIATYTNLLYSSYSKRGELVAITDPLSSAALSNSFSYEFDGLGRLTKATRAGDAPRAYDHDTLGNLTIKAGAALGYDSLHPHQVKTAPNAGTIQYDENGNRTAKGGHTYIFDREGRLVSMDQDAVTFSYGQDGIRFVKSKANAYVTRYFSDLVESDDVNGDRTLTKYYYALGMRIASQTNPNWEAYTSVRWDEPPSVMLANNAQPGAIVMQLRRDASRLVGYGALAGVAVLILWPDRRHKRGRPRRGRVLGLAILWGLGTLPVPIGIVVFDVPAAWAGGSGGGGGPVVSASVIRHYHADHLGSVQAVTDDLGALVQQLRYDEYGKLRGAWNASGTNLGAGNAASPYQFTGYEAEEHSGLQYARARFYDPDLGMFQSHDPQGVFANPYNYGGWDPVNTTDPSGEHPLLVAAMIGAFVGWMVSGVQAGLNGASAKQSAKAGLIGAAIGGATAVGLSAVSAAVSTSTASLAFSEAFKGAMMATGAAGIGQSFADGQYFAGSFGAVMLAFGLYGKLASNESASAGGMSQEEQLEFAEAEYAQKSHVHVDVLIRQTDPNSGDYLERKGLSGHAAVATGERFDDYGPARLDEGDRLFGTDGARWWDDAANMHTGDASRSDVVRYIAEKGQNVKIYSRTVSVGQVMKIRAYWDRLIAAPGRYHFAFKNCTTTVAASLRGAGVSNSRAVLPATLGRDLAAEGWTTQ